MNTATAINSLGSVELQSKPKNGHDISLDGIRLVATLMVVLIHVSGKGFPGFAEGWWAVNAYESVSRMSVPLFFMLTGALLLPSTVTVTSVFRRVWKVLVPLVAWSVLYLSWYKAIGIDRDGWVSLIAMGPVAGHLWYLYTLVAACFFLPVLSLFYKGSDIRIQIFMLCVWFVAASIMPFLHDLLGHGVLGINWSFFYIYPAYLVAGAVIASFGVPTLRQAIISSSICAMTVVGVALLTWLVMMNSHPRIELFYEYYSPLVFLGALSGFFAIRFFLIGTCPLFGRDCFARLVA